MASVTHSLVQKTMPMLLSLSDLRDGDYAVSLQVSHHHIHTFLYCHDIAFNDEVGIMRLLIGRRYAGKFFDFTGARPLVKALDVTVLANCDGTPAVDFYEVVTSKEAQAIAICAHWRDECRKSDDTGVDEQFRHFADSTDIFVAIRAGKAQVAAQAVTNIVAIQNIRAAAQLVQTFFRGMCDSRFSCAGKTCEPAQDAPVAIHLLTSQAGNGGMVPDSIRVLRFHGRTKSVELAGSNAKRDVMPATNR